MKLCSKCKQRPAVVFISNPAVKGNEPEGLCLVCAKELGIKPVDDMLKSMNMSDEDIEMMSNQFMEMFSPDDADDNDDASYEMGTTPAIPFLNNLFSNGDVKEPNDNSSGNKKTGQDKPKKKKKKFLDLYAENLTDKAKQGKLDAIIGREKELNRTVQILSRRTKNNPCLIGEPGVGKTAIAEGLALKIAANDAPARLLDKEIYLLDLTSLVAGTQFRGQFESRVKNLIAEVKDAGNIILFIDEIHNLVGAGDSAEGSMNAANILKPALSRGEIQVIGATTFKEYRKYIEKDAALERRFQPVTVEEPSIDDTIDVLLGVKGYYEGYHSVTIPDDVVRSAVILSERYITDRFLPDKAIDLLDEACACASLENKAIDELYIANKKVADASEKLTALEEVTDEPDYEQQALLKADIEKYKSIANGLYTAAAQSVVTEKELAKVIEIWTGIPASKIEETDYKKLINLNDNLNKKVIGQEDATKLVSDAVKRSRLGIGGNKRPASFIFVGPTGVGKTYLVKVLSEELFNTPETLIRLDMSEFMEKHSVSRIIGAPPGYVGYDEAGQLTEKVRRKPYSVILFDEIEKAHPDVLNILLQILDEGRITDAQGRLVSFQNTVIVMTSNAGSSKTENLLGFGKSINEASKEKVMKALKEFLRPEFISRVDEIVVFSPLDKKSLEQIARLQLEELSQSLLEKHITLLYNTSVFSLISDKALKNSTGAREIKNIIRKEIIGRIVDLMLVNAKINEISIDTADDEFIIKTN